MRKIRTERIDFGVRIGYQDNYAEIAEFDDGMYRTGLNMWTGISGVGSSPFSTDTPYPSYTEAFNAVLDRAEKWVMQQKDNTAKERLLKAIKAKRNTDMTMDLF